MKAETKTKSPLLSPDIQKQIRSRYANRMKTKKDTLDAMSDEFNVSTRYIWMVIQGKIKAD